MATKPKPTGNSSFEDRRVMSPATFRERNRMSKSNFDRRLQLQRLGEPGSENLLPKITQIGPARYGVRYCDEQEWQEARLVSAVATGKQRRAQAAEGM